MKAIEMLREEQRRFRVYEFQPPAVERLLIEYRTVFPDESWADYTRKLSPKKSGEKVLYARCPVVRWGKADTDVIKNKLNVELPTWVTDFYKEIVCAVLPLRICIEVKSPEQIAAHELERRTIIGEDHLPCRLVNFAEIIGDGAHYYFYQALNGKWSITYGPGWEATPMNEDEEQGWDNGDADIDQWLQRMLRTDAFPLMIGNEEIERQYSRLIGYLERK